jgi:hypothetical protein
MSERGQHHALHKLRLEKPKELDVIDQTDLLGAVLPAEAESPARQPACISF